MPTRIADDDPVKHHIDFAIGSSSHKRPITGPAGVVFSDVLNTPGNPMLADNPPVMPPIDRLIWLDLFRGMSAVFVCASHLRSLMFVDHGELHEPSVVLSAFYFVTGLGHQSVIVFFVLSGFFIGGSVLKNRLAFDLNSYATARLTRLWVVLLPALACTALLDFLSSVRIAEDFAVLDPPNRIIPSEPSYSHTTLLGNVFFLQTIVSPVFGTNGPLWSLAYEFWFYVIFPLACISLGVLKTSRDTIQRLVCVVLLVVLCLMLPANVWKDFSLWLLGVLAYLASTRIRFKSMHTVALPCCLVAFLFALVYSKSGTMQKFAGVPVDWAIGVSFACLCSCASTIPAALPGIPTRHINGFSLFLAEISYSLYVVHFPLLVTLWALLSPGSRLSPTISSLSLFLLVLIAVCIFSRIFWYFFERNTGAVRTFIAHRISTKGTVGN